MLDADEIPQVESEEMLARYVFSKSHFSRQNNRVKAAAFMPAPNGELSVTRCRDATDEEIWAVGDHVAITRNTTLRARGDVLAATFISQDLTIKAAPLTENPNHANVLGWPMADKARIKLIAEEVAVAASAKFR